MKRIYAVVLLLIGVNTVFGQLSRELNGFTKLDVTDKINVIIIPSTVDKIVIEGELANKMELIQVENELRLKMTGSYVMQGNKVQATLYSTKLSSIVARKGALISLVKEELKVDSVYLSANEGAIINIVIASVDVVALATTGGSIELKGQTLTQDIDVALGGTYFAKDLFSEQAIVKVSGGGKIQVHVTKSIDAQTRAGGVVDIYGNPKDRKQRKFAGGRINYL